MKDRTTLLFGLDEFVVVDVSRVEDATVRVVIETLAREGACPECGTLSARVKDRPVRRVRIRIRRLPSGRAGQTLQNGVGSASQSLGAPRHVDGELVETRFADGISETILSVTV